VHGVEDKSGDQDNGGEDHSQHDSTLLASTARRFPALTGRDDPSSALLYRIKSLGRDAQIALVRVCWLRIAGAEWKPSSEPARIALIYGEVSLVADLTKPPGIG
jgi:hypothetical protein